MLPVTAPGKDLRPQERHRERKAPREKGSQELQRGLGRGRGSGARSALPRTDLAAIQPAVHVEGGEPGDAEAHAHDGHAGQDLVPHPAGAALPVPPLPAGTPGLPRAAVTPAAGPERGR